MKHICLIILIFVFCRPAQAQINLVPNPSFEDTLNCDSFSIIYAGYPWFTPTNCTPDYFYGFNPMCGNSAFQNPCGFQIPYDGNAYVGLFLTDGTNTREYISTVLLDTLILGKEYYLEFYISRANLFELATDDVGAFLSNQLPNNSVCSYLQCQPQVENSQGDFIVDSLNWTRVSGKFTANGGEKYLTIGNFKDSINTSIIDADSGNGIFNNSYYYIDKISLFMIDSMQGVDYFESTIKYFEVYPSIINKGDILFVNSNFYNNCQFELYFSDGRKKMNGVVYPGINQFDTFGFMPGIYFLYLYDNEKIFSVKFIIY